MSGRDRDRFRKYDCGAVKAKKRKDKEAFIQTQKGALEKFIVPTKSADKRQRLENEDSSNRLDDVTADQVLIPSCTSNEKRKLAGNESISSPSCDDGQLPTSNKEIGGPLCGDNVIEADTAESEYLSCESVSGTGSINLHTSDTPLETTSTLEDIYDPGNWEHVTSNVRDMLVEKGPIRLPNDFEYPKNEGNRHFSTNFFTRKMPNGETVDRQWLTYSKTKDRLFCFPCKLFGTAATGGQMANEGCCDWKHLGEKLQQHEISGNHVKCVKVWLESAQRMSSGSAINNIMVEQIRKEKLHWRAVLTRILAIVQYLAENNSAFRGKNEKLYTPNNGHFLGLVEMLAKFDPTMQEHVRRIKNAEAHDHYLGHRIQNELIDLMASAVKGKIIGKVNKRAKYFAVILDCTPDVSHKEQMSLILRFVDVSAQEVKVMEHFIEFLNVDNATGKGLSEALLAALENHGLDIADCRGQGYDNGANMKGKHQGVQAHILRMNSRAFYTPCGCHNLNLVLGDMAKCNSQAVTFFGVIQRIYKCFAGSTERWKILEEAVPFMTTKSLSETRWECRLESVKALRYQIREVREALLTVTDNANDPLVKSESECLANYELGSFEFILSLIIWYDLLFAVNTVSKTLQSYRETGFSGAMIIAKEIASEINVEQKFKERRVARKKKQFNYESNDESTFSPEEAFRTGYFLWIVDQALSSMEKRFQQLEEYASIFGFLYKLKSLQALNDDDLLKCCMNLDSKLCTEDSRDLDGIDLCGELKIFREMLPDNINTAQECLRYIWPIRDSFPNIVVAYRVMLTIPVTVASAERSFSKLKLIKSYLRSTMAQSRLCSLAILSIEKEIASTMDYEDLINDFAQQKARKVDFRL
ncbi:zinc finger MYM-type protein 1-like [Hyperolius riggenbachi]|uniref:zinc finger MYM-type protein 1-like n=1 Tax=Hyperolius riggenbachi TaxID=752182 RepID=UPI0035A3708B